MTEGINSWLGLGPIYNPAHQGKPGTPLEGHPLAADIIFDIDDNPLDPRAITRSAASAPRAGDTQPYGNGKYFNRQSYVWRILSFADVDWARNADVEDDIHRSLRAKGEISSAADPLSFAGKHHALVFLLVTITSSDDRATSLHVRSDDALRVWLNGEEIPGLRWAGERDINEFSVETRAEVRLRKGGNVLLAAVAETHGEWGFSARIEDSAGLVMTPAEPTTPVPTPVPPEESGWKVSGAVLRADGTPLTSAHLFLMRKRLRHEEVLGEAVSRDDGRYEIVYAPPSDGASVDLVVRVLESGGQIAAESSMVFAAGPRETIDLSLGGDYRAPSAYLVLMSRLGPELDGVALSDLDQTKERKDLSFLAHATRDDSTSVADLAIAHKLAVRTGIRPEVFFALFQNRIPSDLAAALQSLDEVVIDDAFLKHALKGVLDQPTERIEKTLRAAINSNLVPATLAEVIEDELAKFDAMRVQHIGEQPYVRGKTSLSKLAAASGVPGALQSKLVAAVARTQGNMRVVWKQLRSDPAFDKKHISTLRFTLNLGELVNGHLPLVEHFQAQHANGGLKGARDLAKLDMADWKTLLGQVDPEGANIQPVVNNESPEAKIERFANRLTERFERRFPTSALAGRLATDPAAPVTSPDDVVTFLTNNPKFDLQNTHVDRFLKDNAETALSDVRDRKQLVADVKSMQRVFKLVPRYAAVKPLLIDKVDSAQAVYFMGKSRFVQRYGGDGLLGSEAEATWRRAERAYASALALASIFNAAFNQGTPAAATPKAFNGEDSGAELSGFANLQSLFGSLDYCECRDCRSVLGPAAYLVDVLQFLGKRASTAEGRSAQSVLFDRRSDLGDVELSCANTNTPVPYIDLVCETLEDAVAPSPIPARERQTVGSAEDLRATAPFVNTAAYETLRGPTVVFPSTLPFDLWAEEVRAFLGAFGHSRAELMKLYQGAGEGSLIPDEMTIAAEALAIGPAERAILDNSAPDRPWEYWGLAEVDNDVLNPKAPDDPTKNFKGSWLEVLSHVPVFLQRTQLDFRALLQLLDVRFVNLDTPTPVRIAAAPDEEGFASCDTANMKLVTLTKEWLERAYRFLRLWRKTGLTMWNLDRLIACPAVGNRQIGGGIWVSLAAVVALKSKLGLPIDEVLAFWADLDITSYTDRLGEADAAVPSVYERTFRNPLVPDAGVFPADPSSWTGTLDDAGVQAAIRAALGLSTEDISSIRESAGLLGSSPPASVPLDLVALTVFFHYTRLASALRISATDLALWIGLTGTNPFSTPTQTLEFLRRYDVLAATGLTPADLDYLLRHGSLVY